MKPIGTRYTLPINVTMRQAKEKTLPIPDKEAKKRRRERYLIILALFLLAGFTYVEIVFLNVGLEGPLFKQHIFLRFGESKRYSPLASRVFGRQEFGQIVS